jgi:hypothetical protein
MTSEEAWRQAEAQGELKPGEQGWWKVWGARIIDVRAGDLLLVKDANTGEVVADLVSEIRPAGGWAGMRLLYTSDGVDRSIGALAPFVLLRQGTHNMLA